MDNELRELREIVHQFKDLFKDVHLQWNEICEKAKNQDQLILDLERDVEKLQDQIHALEREKA